MQHIGHPVFGDPVYGGRPGAASIRPQHRDTAAAMLAAVSRQALHARRLQFVHPVDGREMDIEAPLPADMVRLLELLRMDASASPVPDGAATPASPRRPPLQRRR